MSTSLQLGDKDGIATTLAQVGNLALVKGDFHEALRCFIKAFSLFVSLNSPHRELVFKNIAQVRRTVGDDQFRQWLTELGHDPEEFQ